MEEINGHPQSYEFLESLLYALNEPHAWNSNKQASTIRVKLQ